jgi:hypothetical protein
MEDSEVVLVSERNDAGLKKLSQVLSEQTRDSPTFLNVTCLLKYVLNCDLLSSGSGRGSLSLVGITEELFERKSCGFGLENLN